MASYWGYSYCGWIDFYVCWWISSMTSPNKGMTNEDIAYKSTYQIYNQDSNYGEGNMNEVKDAVIVALNAKDSLLAKERALSDGLAEALELYHAHSTQSHICMCRHIESMNEAITAYKEARK